MIERFEHGDEELAVKEAERIIRNNQQPDLLKQKALVTHIRAYFAGFIDLPHPPISILSRDLGWQRTIMAIANAIPTDSVTSEKSASIDTSNSFKVSRKVTLSYIEPKSLQKSQLNLKTFRLY